MGLFSSFAGAVWMELTSADVVSALHSFNEMGIPISNVRMSSEFTACFSVPRNRLKIITAFAEKHGGRLRILKHDGIFWDVMRISKRPVLFLGMTLLIVLAFLLPTRVLFVEVEGNAELPDQLVLEAAQTAGIHFGASRRSVRSEKMKNTLLDLLPQLQWAGVNTYGCRAVVSVRERSREMEEIKRVGVSNIVAAYDGVITSCTVTQGTGLCEVGQAVSRGQVLISGFTDCGLHIMAHRAAGEIFAQTRHELSAITPAQSLLREEKTGGRTNYSFRIGKKRINFYKGSGISDGTCVKMYQEYNLALPGGFRLPVALIKEEITTFKTEEQQLDVLDAEKLLSDFVGGYLRSHMIAGSIMDRQEQIQTGNGYFHMDGTYGCMESIGREQGEQIGDLHGKTD